MKNTVSKSVQKWAVLLLSIVLFGSLSCSSQTEKSEAEKNSSSVKAPSNTIHEAVFFGDVNSVKAHIAFKTNLNEKDQYGSAPLHIASLFGRTEVAKLLIEAGADLSLKSADGSTPLHTAAFFGRTEIVEALLAKNADTSVRNNFGSTALESVSAPFEHVKPIYDQMSKDLGPLGLKLDYDALQKARPVIAEMIKNSEGK